MTVVVLVVLVLVLEIGKDETIICWISRGRSKNRKMLILDLVRGGEGP